MPRSDYTLKTLRKGLEVLETLADDRGALTLTALAERLRESPPVVFRILRTLEERGYVEQDASSKRWHPGFRAWGRSAAASSIVRGWWRQPGRCSRRSRSSPRKRPTSPSSAAPTWSISTPWSDSSPCVSTPSPAFACRSI